MIGIVTHLNSRVEMQTPFFHLSKKKQKYTNCMRNFAKVFVFPKISTVAKYFAKTTNKV
jgi:hypothetical protein